MARRRGGSGGAGGEATVDLTPMLDVVFILLIFFIVTAQFIKEPGVKVERPATVNKEQAKPLAILIAIDANSDVYIAKQLVPIEQVGFMVKELRKDNQRGKIVVQADVDSDAETLVAVMEALNRTDSASVINVSVKQ